MSAKMRTRVQSSVEGLGVVAAGRARATFTGVPGWEEWQIELDLAVVDGRVEVRGVLGVVSVDPDAATHLTTRKLAALPLQALADDAMKGMDFTEQPDLQRNLQKIRSADVEAEVDRRSGVTLKDVAEAYIGAYYDHKVTNINQALSQRLNLSVRMVAYKVKEARDLGLIPTDLGRRRSRKTSSLSARKPK